MTEQEEMRDVLVTLLLCEKLNQGDVLRVKSCAGSIAGRVHHPANHEFVTFVRRSPSPLGMIKREVVRNDLQSICTLS